MTKARGWVAVLAITAPAALLAMWYFGFFAFRGEHAAQQKTAPPELAELTRNAESWADRGERILERPWVARLPFRTRLYARVQALRTFVKEAQPAANGASGPPDRLIERGRVLVNQAAPFDTALALLERVTPSLDNITGFGQVIELHMPPLETSGEAPFRIRITDLQSQVKLGCTHLDEALTGILAGSADAKTHENIATHNLSAAHETAAKLTEEVKQTSAAAHAATDREALLKKRIAWADEIVKKLGPAVPAEATQALSEARTYSDKTLPGETAAVIERLRNAQPDGAQHAADLAKSADAVVERLTRAFLELGRKAGVADPK